MFYFLIRRSSSSLGSWVSKAKNIKENEKIHNVDKQNEHVDDLQRLKSQVSIVLTWSFTHETETEPYETCFVLDFKLNLH